MGVEPGRLQFSWVSSAESTKFVDVAKKVTESVQALGPNTKFKKSSEKVTSNVSKN